MFRAMFRVQWQWLQPTIIVLSGAVLLIPTFGFTDFLDHESVADPSTLLIRGQVVGAMIAAIAAVLGGLAAHVLWSRDAQSNHTYALALPVPRRTYLRNRALGALLLFTAPALAVAIGIWFATARVSLPPGMRVFAGWIAVRAYATMAIAFAVLFFARFGVTRRVRRLILVGLIATAAVTFVDTVMNPPNDRSVARLIGRSLVSGVSPTAVLFNPWFVVGF